MELIPIISEQQIAAAVDRIAAEIASDMGAEPLVLIGVLKGSMYFLADLSRKLKGEVQVDFVQVSTYGKERSSTGIFRLVKDLDINIEGRNVLIVEDIVDSGLTLSHLVELFLTRRPQRLRVASLLSKPTAQVLNAEIDYLGFEIPEKFVVGYGLDDAERFRNLPYIAILSEPESEQS
jgi:hypoxanthine phosphoribosyltransferase